MAKQMMQDILTNKKDASEVQDPKPAASARKIIEEEPQGVIEDSLPEPEDLPKAKGRGAGAPAFPPIESSPIFEKMKKHNKDRESLSDEFDANRNGSRLFAKIAIALGVIALVGAFLYGIFFYSAVLSITPKHANVTLQNQEFRAGGASAEALPFQLMTVSDESSTELTATGEKNVVSKASGKIVIYNDYGTQPQPLIKNTRFQSPDGKIYRIRDSVTVPGQKIVDGKQVPGSLEVDVYADAAGPEYNIGLVDFTIPGFKSSPRYEKIYARSKTAMTGGFSGLTKIVSPEDMEKAKEALTAPLKEKLFAEALAQKPKGTVLYKDAVFYSFTDAVDNAATAKSSDSTVKLILKGSLTATLFNEEALSKQIVKTSVAPIDVSSNDRILVTNIEDLTFTSKGTNEAAPKEGEEYSFVLNGEAKAVWQVDTAALQQKLAGVKKADYKDVFADFPGIEKANAHIKPFWKTKFPSDVSKIRVETVAE